MNKDSITDYWACILIRLLGPIIRGLPQDFALFLGQRIGDLFYYFDLKHKAIAYANLKTAFGDSLSPCQLSHLTQEFYRHFGQNLIEILMVPLVDKEYIQRNISFEGLDYIEQGFKKGKGVILLTVHAGSWELSNVICANLGFPFVLFAAAQRYPRLNALLNSYRRAKGCKIIQRQNGVRQLVEALKNNAAVGMTADQGGKNGMLVKFLGKDASMGIGAVRLALRYDACIIPVFYTRIKGAKFKAIIEPAFQLKRTGDLEKDVQDNLQAIAHIFERYIREYPADYLWTYKIWKYSRTKNILILSDSKTGHLNQSQAITKIAAGYLEDKGIKVNINTLEVKFKNKFARQALALTSLLSGKYHCQGCRNKPDIIISCGSSLAPVNFMLSRENLAKSVVIMRPSVLSAMRFDLVVMPRHDNPPKRKNVVVTEGALNLINEEYLKDCISHMAYRISQDDKRLAISDKQLYIGLLIGGNTKHFSLKNETIAEIIKQIKSASEKLDAHILVTTSRRTSKEIEDLVKKEFQDYARCKLLIIANEKNLPFAVGAILGLSQMIVVSAESISMISEAASSGKYILVFKSPLDLKHKRFLNYMAKRQYLYLCQPDELDEEIQRLYHQHPTIKVLKDNLIIEDALKKIL